MNVPEMIMYTELALIRVGPTLFLRCLRLFEDSI